MECAACCGPAHLRCSRCHSALYCSLAHQKLHWKHHKRLCAKTHTVIITRTIRRDICVLQRLRHLLEDQTDLITRLWNAQHQHDSLIDAIRLCFQGHFMQACTLLEQSQYFQARKILGSMHLVLPDDIWKSILHFLRPREVARLSIVNYDLFVITSGDTVWQTFMDDEKADEPPESLIYDLRVRQKDIEEFRDSVIGLENDLLPSMSMNKYSVALQNLGSLYGPWYQCQRCNQWTLRERPRPACKTHPGELLIRNQRAIMSCCGKSRDSGGCCSDFHSSNSNFMAM